LSALGMVNAPVEGVRDMRETLYREATMANRPNQDTTRKQTDNKANTQSKPDKLVDETVWESFPASDPSGSWAGKDIPPDERKN